MACITAQVPRTTPALLAETEVMDCFCLKTKEMDIRYIIYTAYYGIVLHVLELQYRVSGRRQPGRAPSPSRSSSLAWAAAARPPPRRCRRRCRSWRDAPAMGLVLGTWVPNDSALEAVGAGSGRSGRSLAVPRPQPGGSGASKVLGWPKRYKLAHVFRCLGIQL